MIKTKLQWLNWTEKIFRYLPKKNLPIHNQPVIFQMLKAEIVKLQIPVQNIKNYNSIIKKIPTQELCKLNPNVLS